MGWKIFIFVSACLLTVGVFADQTLYKWVDDQGNVHYSDKPHPGATKMKLPATQTYKAPDMSGMPALIPPGQTAAPSDAGITIISPAPESTLWDAESITVAVNVPAGLQNGDAVTISVDGRAHGPAADLSATFDGMVQGEHTVTAVLKHANGQTQNAGPIKFYIEKHKAHKTIQ